MMVVSRTKVVIKPGEIAPVLTGSDKLRFSLKNSFTGFAAMGWFGSSAYEQLTNGAPNTGVDRGAFGERLGMAVIRDTSEGILSDGAIAPLMHEDPRYYRMGSGHNFFVRVAYATTRPLVTRTDDGRRTPNVALMAGNLGGTSLINLYYPQTDRGTAQTFEIFGGSMGGEAVSDFLREFWGDLGIHLHRQRR